MSFSPQSCVQIISSKARPTITVTWVMQSVCRLGYAKTRFDSRDFSSPESKLAVGPTQPPDQ